MSETNTRALRFTKHGLAEDPRGLHVTYRIGDREYLGDVVGVERDFVTGAITLQVRHFNGEQAPSVLARLATVLCR